MNARLRRTVGGPLYVLAAALVAYTAYHRLSTTEPAVLQVGETAVIVVLAGVIAFGGYRIDQLGLDDTAVLPTVAGVFGAYLFGVAFAGTLIGFQLYVGVPMVDVTYLLVTSGSATAALGVGIVLYYHQVQAERSALARRNLEMTAINKRLRLLQRVLRHNLRNEVTVIRGHADIVLERGDDDVSRSARAIRERANRVEQLSENADLLRQVWDTDVVVERDAVRLVRDATAAVDARHPDADIEVDVGARVGGDGGEVLDRDGDGVTGGPGASTVILAHPRVEAAVVEAIQNAVVHTDGPVTVSVRPAGPDHVEIRVADRGDGIPDIEVDALDEPEERPLLHSTGLGLWLIYWLVEAADGDLRFERNDPTGTVVVLRLRAA